MIKNRLKRFQSLLKEKGIEAFLVNKAENIRYLSGFTGGSDASLLISPEENYILTDSRYIEQTEIECPGWEIVQEKPPGREKLLELSTNYFKIGVEGHYITYQYFCELKNTLQSEIMPEINLVEALRLIKDEAELDFLRKTAQISDQVFLDICELIRPGLSERHIANHIVFLLKEKGCDRESFPTIAVAGRNASLPHGQPGDRLLERGDMLTMDYGGFYQGYAGDMTRTVAIGESSKELSERYQAVLEAQQLGVSMVKAGVSCRDIDIAVRECLKKYRLDKFFQHGTGHGVGLEIHEEPRVSPRSEAVLSKNMVITVEPGIYIPGWGGIRIEDTVIVKNGGCELITRSNKELIII